MAKLTSNRVKVRNQSGITSDRYQFLGLDQAEPNLGDPLVGVSSVGVNPPPGGYSGKYVLVAVSGNEGKRYWSSLEDIGAGAGASGGETLDQTLTLGNVSTKGMSVGLSTFTASVAITTTIVSTSSTTGSLVVSGGVGIGSNIFVNGIPIGRYGSNVNNFFVGVDAGISNANGQNNVFLGQLSGSNNTSGNYNNFFGKEAGCCNTSGCNNNFLGYASGENNDDGNDNNFIGKFAGRGNTSGSCNIFLGSHSGKCNISGCHNTFFGHYSGSSNEIGSNNLFFGQSAGCQNISGSGNIVIGFNRQNPIISGNNQLTIGAGNTSWIEGNSSFNVGIGTTNPTSKLHVIGGDVTVGVDNSHGVILTSPNGTKYRLIVSDVGILSTVVV